MGSISSNCIPIKQKVLKRYLEDQSQPSNRYNLNLKNSLTSIFALADPDFHLLKVLIFLDNYSKSARGKIDVNKLVKNIN
jgi:hypothetical protein